MKFANHKEKLPCTEDEPTALSRTLEIERNCDASGNFNLRKLSGTTKRAENASEALSPTPLFATDWETSTGSPRRTREISRDVYALAKIFGVEKKKMKFLGAVKRSHTRRNGLGNGSWNAAEPDGELAK
jgi:hypothetical protein